MGEGKTYLAMFNSICNILGQLDAKNLLKGHDVVFNTTTAYMGRQNYCT